MLQALSYSLPKPICSRFGTAKDKRQDSGLFKHILLCDTVKILYLYCYSSLRFIVKIDENSIRFAL